MARYIAESKLDSTREGKRRPLFSARENDLAGGDDRTYRGANSYLTAGRGSPIKKDLIHFSVSFLEEDFGRLGASDDERKGRLREAAREAMAEIEADLNVAGWRWIAGIHLNTPHPHVHIVIHKEVTDRNTSSPRRLGNLPKRMLPHSQRGADGMIRPADGGVAGRFIAAMELAQERARQAAARQEEKAMALTAEQTRWIDWLLETASRNPSLAGRDLAAEIIERGPESEPGERLNPTDDIKAALRNRSLDDSDYHTQIEQAGELSKSSKELRDLYERGAEIKGDTLIIPAEEYEISDERERIRVINISHAFEKDRIRDPKAAAEFHYLARAIAGETADAETEIKVFKHYYDLIESDAEGRRLDRHGDDYERERAEALDRTLAKMRLLAGEMARQETRESIDVVPSITERSYVYRRIQDYERASEFYSLAQAIAGPGADLQRETQVFSYYYGKLERDREGHSLTPDNDAGRLEAVDRTLTEMRRAVERKAEIQEYAGVAHAIVPLDEVAGRVNGSVDEEEYSLGNDAPEYEVDDEADDLGGPEYEYALEEAYGEREAEAEAWRFNTAARKVNLGGERLRLPAGLTAGAREWLIGTRLPEIDRRIEAGAVLYDKRDKDGAAPEKGMLSDISRLIRPERDEMLRRVSGATELDGYESLLRPPGPDELAEARRILIELSAHEKRELERRRELRFRLETGARRAQEEGRSKAPPDRSYLFNDHAADRLARIEGLIEGLRKSMAETRAGQEPAPPVNSRLYVSLSNDKGAPRLPVGNIRVYDSIERMVAGAKLQLSTWIGGDGPALINGFTEKEYDYRVMVAGFLKSYVRERLRDPETRLTHGAEIFRDARRALDQPRSPEELNRAAHDFMTGNERQGRPLGERERRLLFHGRAPDHYTPEMVGLRLTWGLPREGREQALRDGRLPLSPTLKAMLGELETRRNVESVRQYQKALMTPPEEMRNPGRLPLYQMHKKLLGHERDYIFHLAEEMKRYLPSKEPPVRAEAKAREDAATGRAFGEVPHESRSYKEYIASLGEIKRRLLDEALSRSNNGAGAITAAEQIRIHNRACNLAWERLAAEEVFSPRPSEPALRLSETAAKLQEEAQPRARLAAQALDEFGKENIPSYANGRAPKGALGGLDPSLRGRYEQLKDYAERTREEMYRGFETIDGLRREIEKSRADELLKDRVALGSRVVAEARYECARLDYETARDHGEAFRFSIRDVSLKADRRISAFDVERRANSRGMRAADERGARRAEERGLIRQEVSTLDLAVHGATLAEHDRVHRNLLNKLRVEADRATRERLLAQERAQEVTRKYQERGERVPAPFIDRKTLTETQEQTVKRGLTSHTEKLEEIRVAQSREFNRPERTEEEAARLGAQLFVARTESQAREERASRFDRTRHLRQWEIGGEKWSLADIDRKIERQSDEARIFGRYQLHLDPGGRTSARDETRRLTAIREEIVARIAAQQGELRDKSAEAGKLVEILFQAHERELGGRAQTAQATPKFTRDEFERVADNAATTRDAETLRRLYEFERQFNNYADPKDRIPPERQLARALGREAMAEVFLRESAERLSNFRDRKEVQPLLIEAADGRLITQRFNDTEPRSILELIARPLVEAPPERELREAVHAALEHQQRHLAADLEKSRAYYEAAREISGALSPDRHNAAPVRLPAPEFTPKEEMNIEIYAERLTDEKQRERLFRLLDPGRGSAPSRRDSHNDSDHSREAQARAPDAPVRASLGRGR